MANAYCDEKGRALVAVTGMGIVTSLGRGKTDNWSAVMQGRSGIRPIERFPTDGLRTTIAGTVDFLDVGAFSAPALAVAMALSVASEAGRGTRVSLTVDLPGQPN